MWGRIWNQRAEIRIRRNENIKWNTILPNFCYLVYYFECVPDLSSDHVPIVFPYQSTPTCISYPRRLANNSTNWDEYRNQIEEQLHISIRINSPAELDDAAEYFSKTLQQSIRSCTQYKEVPLTGISYQNFIRQLVLRRRQARKAWRRHPSWENKTLFNKLSGDTTRALHQWRNNAFSSYLSALAPTKEANYSLWTATKSIRRPTQSQSANP